MAYSLIHFVRAFPLRYYLGGGLFRNGEPMVAVVLAAEQVSALVMCGPQVLGYEKGLDNLPDRPPVPGSVRDVGPSVSRTFTAKLLGRWRARGAAQYVMLPELAVGDLYCNAHSVSSLRENDAQSLLESLAEDPRQVFGAWDEIREFRWAVLSPGLKLCEGSFDARERQVMIVGLPAEYCDQIDSWVERQQASLVAIIPPSLACVKWFLTNLAPESEPCALLVELEQMTVVAIVVEQRIVLFRQYAVDDDDNAWEELVGHAQGLGVTTRRVYLWSLGGSRCTVPDTFEGVRITAGLMEQVTDTAAVSRRPKGGGTAEKSAAACLLRWLVRDLA
ncbi:MAG TPA: hypothetical protein VGD78_13020 [Chthoniobacterales bacterium]